MVKWISHRLAMSLTFSAQLRRKPVSRETLLNPWKRASGLALGSLVDLSLEDQPRNPVPERHLVLTDSLRREMRQMHDISWALMPVTHLNCPGVWRCCPMTDPEERGYLPYGHLPPAGEGANACPYCGHHKHHPTLLYVPLTICLLYQGIIPNKINKAFSYIQDWAHPWFFLNIERSRYTDNSGYKFSSTHLWRIDSKRMPGKRMDYLSEQNKGNLPTIRSFISLKHPRLTRQTPKSK